MVSANSIARQPFAGVSSFSIPLGVSLYLRHFFGLGFFLRTKVEVLFFGFLITTFLGPHLEPTTQVANLRVDSFRFELACKQVFMHVMKMVVSYQLRSFFTDMLRTNLVFVQNKIICPCYTPDDKGKTNLIKTAGYLGAYCLGVLKCTAE
jgi:hypothetical protein